MLLTRAQLLCAWGVAQEQPTNAQFDISAPDDKGAVYMQVEHSYGSSTWKLPPGGGREKITQRGVTTPLELAVSNDETVEAGPGSL